MSDVLDAPVPSSNPVAEVTVKPKRKGRIRKFVGRTLFALLIAIAIAQLAFTFSGSGKWESLGARKGVEIFVKKTPGSNIKEYKAVFKVKSTLNRFVAFSTMEDTDMQIGYYDMSDVQKVSERLIYSTWKQKFPSPFKPRHFVVKNEFSQDPLTKVLTYHVQAANDKMPYDPCCVRVPKMNNDWHLTPLGNGELRVEWHSDLDMGGFLPYFMLNAYQPGGMRFFAHHLEQFLNAKKFDKVHYAWIQEP